MPGISEGTPCEEVQVVAQEAGEGGLLDGVHRGSDLCCLVGLGPNGDFFQVLRGLQAVLLKILSGVEVYHVYLVVLPTAGFLSCLLKAQAVVIAFSGDLLVAPNGPNPSLFQGVFHDKVLGGQNGA